MKVYEKQIEKGAVILHESKTHITLRLKKKFGWGAFIGCTFIFNIFGIVGYLVYYNFKKGNEITYSKENQDKK